MKPSFGEVFVTNDILNGGIENIKLFKGKLISSLCGGCRKIYIIEEGQENRGYILSQKNKRLISTLHQDEDETFDAIETFDFKGSIRCIVTGKKNTVFVTENGDTYSFGYGEYGALGHGGILQLNAPKRITRLQKVSHIACGEFHSLALTNGDLFAWGRGFEGQLGIRRDVDTASSPMFLSYFYKNPINQIACGAYHSLAVDHNGQLYGWGEARFGQLGGGRKVKEMLPTKIILEKEGYFEQSQIKVTTLNQQNYNTVIISVSGGYGHSAAVTEEGELYTWGFNQRGQLGHGDKKSSWFPKRVMQDLTGNPVPLFQKVVCGYYTSFAIDKLGHLWSWGGGNLGQQNEKLCELPRKLEIEDRKFTNILANGNAAAFFASMKIISMKPNLGPSTGGTIMSLIGTGFCDTGRQSVRFKVGTTELEVGCEYDPQTDGFRCQTPNFEELLEQYPYECTVEVTLDGQVYVECEQKFLIYSSKIVIQSLYPKCASINGGTTLILNMNIDDTTVKYIQHLNVGFQPRTKAKNDQQASKANNKPLNPLDISINDPELEKENWVCVEGFYDKNKISCVIPKVSQLQSDSLNFNVDVSLNGQQFSGNPVVFRFYDITIKEIRPDNVMSDGGTQISIIGDGFFDTTNKKVIFKTQFGERLIEIMWDKQDRFYTLVAPPLSWLLGGQAPTPELLNKVKETGVQALLTLSGIEWLPMGTFYYIDPEVVRLGPTGIDEKLPEEEKKHRFNAEEPIPDPFHGLNEAEKAKKQDEINKQLELEEQEINYFFKKHSQYLYIYGQNFIKSEKLVVQFIYQGTKAILGKAVFKNKQKLGVQIPDIEELPTGIHDIIIEISLNGQQFSRSGKQFKYFAFDKALTEQQKTKLEDEEMKKLKKNPPKKGGK